ncbi:MAG: nicotinamide-nucleotide amidohydrolase family protein, partial [Actinomycetia bacterium]|nr:nicotinamide-nucleotide amidohydrolase family protein [Actinomycetes bacterium]
KIERLIPPGADRGAFMRQAYLPEGASWLGPVKGSAPGIAVELKGTIVYALPGVPAEMTAMLERISSDLQHRFGATSGTAMRKVKLKGLSEPEASRLVDPIITSYQHLTFNILASSKDIVITIISQDDNVGRQDLDKAVEAVIDCLGGSVYGFDDQTLSRVVGELLSEKGLSLGIAESLTGGRIAAEITATPGSSKYFAGAVVAYENEIKHELLEVSDKTLMEKGAVSSETALEMARGVRDSLGVDVGLSSTGISGPEGGSTDKPIGLVFIAVSDKHRETVREFRFGGDRDAIQNNSAFTALNMLRLFLSDHDRQ